MRGFLGAAITLVFLDVVLKAPIGGLGKALSLPTSWLVSWMDPTKPLINRPLPGSTTKTMTGNPANASLGNGPLSNIANPGIPPGPNGGKGLLFPPGSQNI